MPADPECLSSDFNSGDIKLINRKQILAPACLLVVALTLSSCATFKKTEFVTVGNKRFLIAKVHVANQPDKVIEYQVFDEEADKYYSCGDTREECIAIFTEEQDFLETESVPEFIRKPVPKPKPDPFATPENDTLGPVIEEETSFGD